MFHENGQLIKRNTQYTVLGMYGMD